LDSTSATPSLVRLTDVDAATYLLAAGFPLLRAERHPRKAQALYFFAADARAALSVWRRQKDVILAEQRRVLTV
jgi:hypothetical protein